MKKKYQNILLFVIFCFLLIPMETKATTIFEEIQNQVFLLKKKNVDNSVIASLPIANKGQKSGEDPCVAANTCVKVCEWENTNPSGYHVYAYYMLQKQTWRYVWYLEDSPYIALQEAVTPDQNIFYQSNAMKNSLLNKGVCPQGAYIDTSSLIGNTPELCFDTTNIVKKGETFCQRKSNLGTSFSGTSKLVYNFEDQLKEVMENSKNQLKNTSCDMISSNYQMDINKVNQVLYNMQEGIKNNFTHDHSVPSFITNGIFETEYSKYKTEVKNLVNSCTTSLKALASQDYQNGKISRDEYTKALTTSPDIEKQLDEKLDQIFEDLESGKTPSDPADQTDASCESLLGPTITGYLKTALSVIQIAGIVLAVFLSITDFLGAVLVGAKDSNTKAGKKVLIRIGMAAVLLLVPAILKILLSTFGLSEYDNTFCILP